MEHRAARRAELIEAVLQAVRERGPAVDMDDVAAVSGVAKPVFYRYFADKGDLYLAVGRSTAERSVARVVAATQGPQAPRGPRAVLAAGIDAFLCSVEQDPDVYRFVLQRPATAAAVSDYSTVLSEHVSRLLGDLLRAAGLDSGVAEPWGFAIVGAVRSSAERWLDQPVRSREALTSALTDLLWSGCSAAPRTVRLPPAEPGGPLAAPPHRRRARPGRSLR